MILYESMFPPTSTHTYITLASVDALVLVLSVKERRGRSEKRRCMGQSQCKTLNTISSAKFHNFSPSLSKSWAGRGLHLNSWPRPGGRCSADPHTVVENTLHITHVTTGRWSDLQWRAAKPAVCQTWNSNTGMDNTSVVLLLTLLLWGFWKLWIMNLVGIVESVDFWTIRPFRREEPRKAMWP